MSQFKVKNIVFKDMIVNEISCNNNIDSTTNKLININSLNMMAIYQQIIHLYIIIII